MYFDQNLGGLSDDISHAASCLVKTFEFCVSSKGKAFGSPGIMVATVAQASSLHGQDARPTVMDEKRITLNAGEPSIPY